MKIQADVLYQAVKKTTINKFSKLPILNYMLLQVEQGKITLAMTNLDDWKVNTLDIPCNETWSICVPMTTKIQHDWTFTGIREIMGKWRTYHPFLDWIQVCSDYGDMLDIQYLDEQQHLVIHSNNSTTIFKGLDAMEFPSLPKGQ